MTLEEFVNHHPYPPCSGDDGGENDARVAMTLGYALGLMRNSKMAREIVGAIARVHAHQSDLFVLCHTKLPPALDGAFRLAWEDIGHGSAVRIVMVGSPDWDAVWAARGFESDWTP